MCKILVPYLDSASPEWQLDMAKAKSQLTKASIINDIYSYSYVW